MTIQLRESLSPEQRRAREGKLTASSVAPLMTGDADKLMTLWRDLTGDPYYVPEDLSGVWPVQLGVATEHLNIHWFERKYGPTSRHGEVATHANGWASCTLDAWSDKYDFPVETKHTGGFEKIDTIIARYYPQIHWIGHVTGARNCILSVIMGAKEPIVEFIKLNEKYLAELVRRAESFWQCVLDLTPPVALPPEIAPVKVKKSYDYSLNNAWVSDAVVWITNKDAKKDFEAAEKSLKSLVPSDALKVVGGGIECKRDRAGKLSIRERK